MFLELNNRPLKRKREKKMSLFFFYKKKEKGPPQLYLKFKGGIATKL